MLFCKKAETIPGITAEAGKIHLEGVSDGAGRPHLEGGFRLPSAVADAGRIRLGGGFRLPVVKHGLRGEPS